MDFFSSQLSIERSELRSTKKALEETILKLEVHTLGPFSRIFLNDVPMLLSTFWPVETRTYLKHEVTVRVGSKTVAVELESKYFLQKPEHLLLI